MRGVGVSRGDSGAIDLRAAANELEASGLTVARRLDPSARRSPSSCPAASSAPCRLREDRAAPAVAAPRSVTELLAREPAVGAVALALQEAAGGAIVPAYKQS